MMNVPLISIIVPVYKAEQTIDKCIQSICDQTLVDWELILVDDGSSDNSGLICDKYAEKDNRIRCIHTQNGGVSSARNIGLDLAVGEFITFVDSDDYIGPTYLQDFIDNKDYDLILTGLTCFSVEKEENLFGNEEICYEHTVDFIKDWKERFDKTKITIGGLSFVAAKAIRGSIIRDNNIRFNQEMILGEDTCMVFDCLRYTKNVKIIPGNNYFYYQPQVVHSYRFDLKQCLRHCQIYIEKVKEIEKVYDIYPKSQVDAYCAMVFRYYYLSQFNCSAVSFIRNIVNHRNQIKKNSQFANYEALITNENRRTYFAIKHPILFYIYKTIFES